jgi:RNA-binding motif protein, X-linked 2
MYEDQRSTILAVDNLNGATVLDRTLRVDHVKKYKQPRVKGEDGEWQEREEQSLNAKPEMIGECPVYSVVLCFIYSFSLEDPGSDSSASSASPNIDPDDPMHGYLLEKLAGRTSKEEREEIQIKGET